MTDSLETSKNAGIRLFDLMAQKISAGRYALDPETFYWDSEWSPDGQWLVVTTVDQPLRVVNTTTGQTRWTSDIGNFWSCYCSWHPDSSTLAVADWDGQLFLFDAVTGELRWKHAERDWDCALSFSPDGQTLFSGVAAGDIDMLRLIRASDGQTIWETGERESRPYQAAWDSSGTYLAVGGDSHFLGVYQHEDGRQLWRLPGGKGFELRDMFRWCPGRLKLLANTHREYTELTLFDGLTGEALTQVSFASPVRRLFWHPSGDYVYTYHRSGKEFIHSLGRNDALSLLAPEDVPPEVALWFDHRKRRFATQNLADQTTIHFADSPSVLLLRWGEVLALRGPGRTPDDVLWATPGVGEQYGWQVQETGSEARIVPFDTYYPQHK